MQELKKKRKKLYVSAAVSACLILTAVPAAYAGQGSPLDNQIGNTLEAEFNVTTVDVEDTVVLSWDASALQLDKKSYDLTKDNSKEIEYYISPGAENDDDLTVSVLLQIPTAAAAAVELEEGTDSFVEGDYTYYYIDQDLEVNVGDAADSNEFDITFKAVSPSGVPFTAKLLALNETPAPPAPVKTSLDGYIQNDSPNYYTDMYVYLTTSPVAGDSTGKLIVDIGDLTLPPASDGAYDAFVGTSGERIYLLEEYYDAASHTFTIPIQLAAGAKISGFRINSPTYSSTPNSPIKFKYDQDGDGNGYTISDEMTVTYTVNAPD